MNNRPQRAPMVGAKSFFAAVFGALVLCVGLVIPAARASDSPAEAPISSVPPPLQANFSIFRSPAEVVPIEIASAIATANANPSPLSGDGGFNVALAQEVELPGAHPPLWAVPGRNQVMLFEQPRNGSFGGAGTTISRAVKRGVVLWSGVPKSLDPRMMRVKGLAPDGVTGVRLSKTAVAPVIGNAFIRNVDQKRLWEKWVLLPGAHATKGG